MKITLNDLGPIGQVEWLDKDLPINLIRVGHASDIETEVEEWEFYIDRANGTPLIVHTPTGHFWHTTWRRLTALAVLEGVVPHDPLELKDLET